MGAASVSLQDIDIAHRVPSRQASNKPDAIVCKFVRRLAREEVLSKRRATNEPSDLGMAPHLAVNHIRLYEHLTPSLQQLLFEAKSFQTRDNFKHCWAKNAGAILLRETDNSRVIKVLD